MNLQPLLVLNLPQAGANHSCGASMTNRSGELLLQTASIINPSCLYNLGYQLLVCLLPRYMRAYRLLPSCNNSPLFRLRGYLACRTVGSNLVVSVAWQWLFSTLDNSAFQTTCHNIYVIQCIAGRNVTSVSTHEGRLNGRCPLSET
jgi:hypothetical protein